MSKLMIAAASLSMLAGQALGTVVILGNMPPANDGTQSATLNDLRIKAIQFTMPAGPGYFLHQVVLRLRGYDPAETPLVQIRDDAGTGSPGAGVVTTLLMPTGLGSVIANYTATPPGTVILAGGATYWLYVGGPAGQAFDWMASSPGIVPTGVATYGLNRFTTNGGSSWTASTIINTFQIVGKEVPAPGALALLGLGGLMAARRRR